LGIVAILQTRIDEYSEKIHKSLDQLTESERFKEEILSLTQFVALRQK